MVRLRSPSTLSRVEGLILNSFAKLNLYLEVLNIRKDACHNLKTLFERISLCDKIILKPRQDKLIRITCNDPAVPKDKTNLCYRAAELLRDGFNVDKGLDIRIIKRIPVGSGMGGGSSNAACVLLGLNKLWKLSLAQKKLVALAGTLGSDIAFFVYNAPFALGSGRGERVKLLKTLQCVRLWHILVVPKIKVSTPLIYKKWDAEGSNTQLTRPKSDVNILTLALKKNNLSLAAGLLFNSLEGITIKLYPEVKRIKEKLAGLGLKSILMSGSGPAVFGIVSSRKEAVDLSSKLKKQKRRWQVYVTKTV